MTTRIYIDGEQGTTGLQIRARLSAWNGIEFVALPEAQRKDVRARAQALNDCDVAVLCLPDEAAREAVSLIRQPKVRVVDASSAHRLDPQWIYGFPEMSAGQAGRIAQASRVSNPGCYPTGAIALLRPLTEAGWLGRDAPISVHAVSGYSGRGREGVRAYEGPDAAAQPSLQVYGLDLRHKHGPEIQRHACLHDRPLFVPAIGRFRQGIVLTIALHPSMLSRRVPARAIRELLTEHYRNQPRVRVLDDAGSEAMLALDPEALNGTDDLQLGVFGLDVADGVLLTAVLDNLGKGAAGAAVQNLALMLDRADAAAVDTRMAA